MLKSAKLFVQMPNNLFSAKRGVKKTIDCHDNVNTLTQNLGLQFNKTQTILCTRSWITSSTYGDILLQSLPKLPSAKSVCEWPSDRPTLSTMTICFLSLSRSAKKKQSISLRPVILLRVLEAIKKHHRQFSVIYTDAEPCLTCLMDLAKLIFNGKSSLLATVAHTKGGK